VSTQTKTQDKLEPRSRQIERSRLSKAGSWIAMPIGIVVVIIAGSVLSDRFFSIGNFVNILNSMSIVGIIVVGMTFVLVSGGMADLSVPANVAMGGIIVLGLQPQLGTAGAMLVGIAAAGIAGMINGLLIGYARANSIIVTLGVGIIVLGIAQATVGGVIVYGTDPSSADFVKSTVLGLPMMVVIFIVIAVIGHVLLSRTPWGRSTYAIGSNYRATEASAVNVRLVSAGAFILTALLAGLAGSLLGLTLQAARPAIGTGYEFDAITAVVVGGVSLLGGAGSIPRAIGGLLFVQLLTNVLVLQGVPTPVQGLAKGILIVGAVAIDIHLRKRGGRS
jgi:ribose/xylose/arabinose/galactoside ABC-type transport system permease subunit